MLAKGVGNLCHKELQKLEEWLKFFNHFLGTKLGGGAWAAVLLECEVGCGGAHGDGTGMAAKQPLESGANLSLQRAVAAAAEKDDRAAATVATTTAAAVAAASCSASSSSSSSSSSSTSGGVGLLQLLCLLIPDTRPNSKEFFFYEDAEAIVFKACGLESYNCRDIRRWDSAS